MTDKTAADVADKALDALTSFTHQLADLAQQQAPQAWALAKGTARVSAAGSVLEGIASLIGGLVLGWIGWKVAAKNAEKNKDGSDGMFVCGGAMCIGAAVLGVIAATQLFEIWNWAGMFYPELYITHSLLKL